MNLLEQRRPSCQSYGITPSPFCPREGARSPLRPWHSHLHSFAWWAFTSLKLSKNLLLIVLRHIVTPVDTPQWISNIRSKFDHDIHNTGTPEPPKERYFKSTTRLADGAQRFSRARAGADPDVLWLLLNYDETSWGHPDDKARRFEDFLYLLESTELNLHDMSLGLMTSSEDEFDHFIRATRRYPFARVTVFLHPGFNEDAVLDRDHRHDDDMQGARRAELAKLRNYLMLRSLHDERHIVWLDADVYALDQGIVQRMIAHSNERDDVGVIAARCSEGGNPDYDLNAWAGTRENQQHANELVAGSTDDELLPLTAVGATLLYIRASLVRRGVNFPYHGVVGTRWGEDGNDGIESEGVCYQARGLKGGGCFLLGGSWHVNHGF